MDINNFLKNDLIYFDKKFKSKTEALKFFAQQLEEKKYATDKKKVYQLFLERENQFSTGVGNQIALPHIRDDVMTKSVVMFAKLEKPLNWESIDNKDVKYIFAITMSKKEGEKSHLEIIADLSSLLINDEFINKLSEIKTASKLKSLINEFTLLKKSAPKKIESSYDYVAVTACPTGIAHTFLAAEKLEKVAQELGIKVKVETQGTEGSKNTLTQKEIDESKGVILALDRAVDTVRFKNHSNVIETSTRQAIHSPYELFKEIKNQQGKKLKNITGSTESGEQSSLSFDGFWKRSYRSILTGVSYMLPFVIFGGILIAIAFLIDSIGIWSGLITNPNYKELGSISFGSQWFKTIGGQAFSIMVPILAAYIAYSIVGKFGLLPGFLVGFMSTGSMKNFFTNIGWLEIADVNSGFFGSIIGAFLASAIIIVFSKYIFKSMPKSMAGVTNILLLPLFSTLVTVFLFFFINIPLQYVNLAFTKFLQFLEGKPEILFLLGLVIGIMMASDLGGPINKAAYIFGTITLNESLKTGNGSTSMAAAIIAGMIPPLGIALSTIISKKYWSKEEVESAKSNWIFGLTFISEGAIPFTAAKPKVVIPGNLIGGGIAGLIIGALAVTSAAPHGGIFILPLFKTALFTDAGLSLIFGIVFALGALIIGTLSQALTMHFLFKFYAKKEVKNNDKKISTVKKNS